MISGNKEEVLNNENRKNIVDIPPLIILSLVNVQRLHLFIKVISHKLLKLMLRTDNYMLITPSNAAVILLALANIIPLGAVSAFVPIVATNTVTSPEIVDLHVFTLVGNFLLSSQKATLSGFVVESTKYLRKNSVYGTYMLQICHAPGHVYIT